MAKQQNPRDKQAALSGKVENDSNKLGNKRPTQKNEGRRTPQSRHDREMHAGSENQIQVRKAAPSSGTAPKRGGR